MERREKLVRIVQWFDDRRRQWELARLLQKRGVENCLSDDAMEEYARMLWRSYRFTQKLNRENRARRLANG